MSTLIEFPGWRGQLVKGDKQQILATVANAIVLLEYDPNLRGMLGFNELEMGPAILRPPPTAHEQMQLKPGPYPRPMDDDADADLILAYLQRQENSAFARRTIDAAIGVVARTHRFHPVCDYLNGLVWDGKPRLHMWLQACFGSSETPYVRAVGTAMLVASVRRVRQPGCKHDCVPILQGPQGAGKSTVIRVLYSPWYTDALPADVASKDAAQSLGGMWAMELSEIDQLIRSDVETVKAYVSRQVDRFRPPFGRATQQFPRQISLIGTTNSDNYLRDGTGNRRFWPIDCPTASPDWAALNRDQLWAEAAILEKAGEPHWLAENVTNAATKQQASRLIEDVWDQPLIQWLEGKTEVTTADVLTLAIGVGRDRQGRREVMRACDCLRRVGWEQRVSWRAGKASRMWFPSEVSA